MMPIARPAAATLAVLVAALVTPLSRADDKPWTDLGRQGMTRIVIVPLELAADRDAYARQLQRLCAGSETCFVNFYTNSRGVELSLPLPDAVASEPTAVFRRSAKQGAELMRFSCRLQLDTVNCF